MDRFIYCIALVVVTTLRVLPIRVCFGLGMLLGLGGWVILPRYRRLAKENLTRAFGDSKSSAALGWLTFQHFLRLGANTCSAFRAAAMNEAQIRQCASVENFQFVTEALHQGRGVVLMISHIGNWELMAQATYLARPYPIGTIYQAIRNRYIDDLINQDRRRNGVATFDRKRGLGKALAMLKEGGLVGVLVDQHAGVAGVWMPLFGSLCSTSPLAASLATRTGAAVIPLAVQTTGFAKWKLIAKPAIPFSPEEPEELTAEINRVLEEQIRASPADWFWVHNRWKTPHPDFLLASAKRGIYLPKNFDPMSLKPFRILIRSSNWLGDAVMSAPAVRSIKAGRPDAHVTILTQAKLADFWRSQPDVDAVIAMEEKAGVVSTGWRLRRQKFEAAILFPNSARSALEVWLGGIPRRVGYEGHNRKWMLNQIIREPKKKAARPLHHAARYLHIAEKIGGAPVEMKFPALPPRDGPVRLAICPGAEYGSAKRWQPVRFRRMMQIVSERISCSWTIFGVEKDREIADEIAEAFGAPCENLAGRTTLAELIEALREIDVLVSNDTGTMHLAAALGVPVVAVFGSTEPTLTAPLGEKQIVIRHQVECSPCFLRECPIDFRCMDAVTISEVADAVMNLLGPRVTSPVLTP